MASLRVDNEFLDLSDNDSVPTTFAVNEIGKLSERQGIRSIKFKLPGTDKNHRLLGYVNKISFVGTQGPNKHIPAELRQNNTTLSFGFLQIITFDSTRNIYDLRFFGGNVEWFQPLKDKLLNDIDLTEFNHVYDEDSVVDSKDNTEGYVYTIIDYGEFTTRATNIVTFDEFFPSVFVHTLVKQMFEDIGFKITGSALQLPIWNKLVLPFANVGFFKSAQFIDLNSVQANAGSVFPPQSFTSPAPIAIVQTPTDFEFGGFDKADNFDTTLFRYTAPDLVNIKVEVTWFDINGNLAGTKRPEATLRANGITVLQTIGGSADEYQGAGQHTIRFDTELVASGDFLEVLFRSLGGLPIQFEATGNSAVKFFIQPTLEPDSIVDISNSVPNIKQVDLLRTLFFQFGIVFTTDNFTKTVSFDLFSDVKKNIINAVDWSNKLDIGKTQELDFVEIVQDYSKVNVTRYAADGADVNLESYQGNQGRSYGDGVIEIDNEFLKDRTNIFTSVFAPTINIDSFNGDVNIPAIPFFETPGDPTPTLSPVARIMILAGTVPIQDFSSFTDLVFTGQTVTEIPYAFFYKGSLSGLLTQVDDQLAFDHPSGQSTTGTPLLEKYYSDQRIILNEPRFLKAFFDINQIDITNLDFKIPVFLQQFDGYFYINKIKQYKANQESTKTELIRLQ